MQRDEVEAFGHRLLPAMTERDFATLEKLLQPDVRLRSLIARMGRDFVGFDGLRDYFRELSESFEEVGWRFLDVAAIRGDAAVVRVSFRARGRGSGIEIDEVHPQVWRLRDGRGYLCLVYRSLDDALASAELGP